jgi:hypothetical protein
VLQRTFPDEKIRSEIYPYIVDGVINYVNDVVSIFGEKDIFISYSEAKNWLNIFIEFPAAMDKQNWSTVKFAVDIGHDMYSLVLPEWYKPVIMIIKTLFRRIVYSSPSMFYACLNILNVIRGLKSMAVKWVKKLFLRLPETHL